MLTLRIAWLWSGLSATVLFATPSAAQGRMDIVQILGQFIGAETAAKECGVHSNDDEPLYRRNRLAVTVRAGEALKERHPSLSKEALTQFETEAIKNIVSRVSRAVETLGCQSSEVQQLLKLYNIQSKIDLGRPVN